MYMYKRQVSDVIIIQERIKARYLKKMRVMIYDVILTV